MTAKYLSVALPLLSIVAALGCTQSTAQAPPVVSGTPATPHKTTVATAKPRELRSANIAQTMQPLMNTPSVIVTRTTEGGIGLTGPARSYIQQVDPSGWSGISAPAAPEGIGGGPATESVTETNENPYSDD